MILHGSFLVLFQRRVILQQMKDTCKSATEGEE